MLQKLRVIKRNQKGFSLVEILIAIALTAIIGSAVAVTVNQFVNINSRSTNHQIAVSQVQHAVNSISRDAQQAQQVSPASFNLVSGGTLTITWVDWNTNIETEVVYKVTAKTLTRNDVPIASNIEIAGGTWDSYERTITFNIQAKVAQPNALPVERTFQIRPRPAQ